MILATHADVEALLGYPIPEGQVGRIDILLEMASSIVGPLVGWPDGEEEPAVIRYVTASLVVRTIANPGQLSSESVGTYRAGFGAAGMALTEDDWELLGPWLVVDVAGNGAYSVHTPRLIESAGNPAFDWQRDLV